MKPPRLLRIPATLLILFIYLSCNKSENSHLTKIYKPEYVTATVSGRVTDDGNKPVGGALVKAGSASATTNIDGAFTISDVNIDKNAAFIKVEKDGFFLGTKTIVASANKNNPANIRLIRKIIAGTITGTTGGAVTVPSNGGTISFEANSFVNPTGNTAYTGTVAVSAFFINPEASDFNDIMPGTLRGINTNNQETGLQSFGMMAVELTGTSGEKLQLAAGKTATLHFPIPISLQSEAPATIPLWSLDETTGLWKEEGKATREGNEYIGTVSHFSFWNCDAPFPVIDFTGIIRNQQGSNMDNAEIIISVPAGGGTAGSVSAGGYTNADGVFNGKLPANKILQLKIYNKCRTLLHTQNIGPFSTTTDLGVITVSSTTSPVTISGTVKNCLGTSVSNGFVSIKLEDIFYNVPITNGNFTTTINRCNDNPVTATLIAYDQSQEQLGKEVSTPVSGNTVNAGALVACGATADTYIKYTLDGINYELVSPADTVWYFSQTGNNTITVVTGLKQGETEDLDLVIMFTGAAITGSHPVVVSDFYLSGPDIKYMRTGSFNANITEYGTGPGGYLMGTFSGNVRDSLNTKTVPVNCSFRVRRES